MAGLGRGWAAALAAALAAAGPAAAQTDTPVACVEGQECPPVEQPVDAAPVEQPAEQVQEQPVEQPAEQVQEQPVEQPAEQAQEQPVEQPAEQAQEQPVEQPPEQAQEQPVEQPAEQAQEQPVEQPAEQAQEQPVEQPAEQAQEQPVDAAPECPEGETCAPAEPVLEAAPTDQPAEPILEATPTDQPADQPAVQSADPAPEATPETTPVAAETDTVLDQLEAQGDSAAAEQVRELRGSLEDQLLEALAPAAAAATATPEALSAPDPTTGADAPRTRAERRERRRELFERRADEGEVVERRDGRIVTEREDGGLSVESELPDEGGRLLFGARDVQATPLAGGGLLTVVRRPNGVEIVTERDRYGEIVRRSRVLPNGREIVLIAPRRDAPPPEAYDDAEEIAAEAALRRAALRRIRPPRAIDEERAAIDVGRADRRRLREALLAPPLAELDEEYALDDVLRTEPLRAYAPRIELDTITFDSGKATINDRQMGALFDLGEALEEVIARNPNEVYLLEGHTDAVGSDLDNLFLSDRRAEAVAVALSQNFEIPPENLVTEGYGEEFLAIDTPGPERRNRRVTVRRLTELLARQ